jgi:hypothetical protein
MSRGGRRQKIRDDVDRQDFLKNLVTFQTEEEASNENPGHFQGVTPKAGLSNFTPLRRAWSTISAT